MVVDPVNAGLTIVQGHFQAKVDITQQNQNVPTCFSTLSYHSKHMQGSTSKLFCLESAFFSGKTLKTLIFFKWVQCF